METAGHSEYNKDFLDLRNLQFYISANLFMLLQEEVEKWENSASLCFL